MWPPQRFTPLISNSFNRFQGFLNACAHSKGTITALKGLEWLPRENGPNEGTVFCP
jgi:hypothetical protein